MTITREADYAIRIMRELAKTDGTVSAQKLSVSTGVPARFAVKILRKLSKANLIASKAGTCGGYSLCRATAGISLKDIIISIEGGISINKCVGSDYICEASSSETCPVCEVMQKINRVLEDELDKIKLSELI